MADQKVPIDDLYEAGASLNIIRDELEAAGDASRDDFRRIVGHSTLAERLDSFAGNWDKRRQEMIDSIGGLGEFAVFTAETYTELEIELEKALIEFGEALKGGS